MSTKKTRLWNPPVVPHLWDAYDRTRSIEDRNRICDAYRMLVKVRAELLQQRLPDEVDVDDLVQFGAIGLMQAVERFDRARGIQFQTYASLRITGAIIDGLRDTARHSRTSLTAKKVLDEAEQRFTTQIGRPPTAAELCDCLGTTEDEFKLMARMRAPNTVSLSFVRFEGEARDLTSVQNLVDEDAPEPADVAELSDQVQRIFQALLSGSFRLTECLVVRCIYLEQMTQKKTAEVVSVTESRVSQIHSSVMPRLRAMLTPAA